MKKSFAVIVFSVLILFSSCGQKKDYVVTIKTKHGDMIAILYDETPKHKENFIKLAKEHYFDSLLFHRVIKGFMIQGGDPDSRNAAPGVPLGKGGPTYTIEAEFNPKLFHEKGALSAARMPDQQNPSKASSGSQFYIVHGTVYDQSTLTLDEAKMNAALQQFFQNTNNKPAYDSLVGYYQRQDMKGYQECLARLRPRVEKETNMTITKEIAPEKLTAYTTVGGAPHLDGGYTVFGKVVKGLEVIDKIAAEQVDQADRPTEDVRMAVTIEEVSRKKIEKEYGYKYPDDKK